MNYKKILISFLLFSSINSVNASLLWNLDYGVEKVNKNDATNVKNYFIEYIKSNPNDEDGYYWLARSYSILKDDKNAIASFKKAHEIALKERNIGKIDFNADFSTTTEDYFDMAAMYFESGDLAQAKSYADLMLEINPKSSSAYFIKAKVAQSEGDVVLARELLNKAITYNNKLIRTNLAKSLRITKLPEVSAEMYEVFALEAYYSKESTEAIRYCRKYLTMHPENIDMANMLIDLYIKTNDIFLAQKLIDETLAKNPNIQTLLYQARIYELKKDPRVVNVLKEAYLINPNNSKVLLNLGDYYLKKADYLNAKKYFENLINVNDEFYEGYFGYIYSLIELGQIQEAMNLIRKMISLNPETSEGDYLLAKICFNQKDYKSALEYINQAIEKAKNPYYFFESAKINYEAKDFEDSIDDLKMALQMPNSEVITSEIEDYLILNYLKLGEAINAQSYLNKKLSLDKNRIMYKYNLYVIYKLQGNENLAQETLELIEKSRPISIQDYVDLSEIYFEESNFEKSLKLLTKGIKKFPNSYELYSQKAKIYTKLNKPNRAKQTLDTFTKASNN